MNSFCNTVCTCMVLQIKFVVLVNKSPDTSAAVLVVTVGEVRLRLFPNYYFWIQNTTDPQGSVQQQHFLTN